MRKTYAEINLKNLIFNYSGIKRKAGGAKVMAVVKADAYGHGMLKVTEALENLGDSKPAYYGVALTEEGVELRKSRLTESPILTFSPFSKDEIEQYQKYKIIPTLSDFREAVVLKKLKLKKALAVHINIDTGMGRLGVRYDEAVEFFEKINAIENIKIDGVYTHFACSDEADKAYTEKQLYRFKGILALLKEKNIDYGIVHAANSGAILDHPEAYFDMVRPGISLYGYYPSLETSESIKLKPVMSLISHISSVKELQKGDSVSYGRLFTAPRKMRIFSLPVGYADGYNRNLTNKAKAIVKKSFVNQVGRVTMDRIMFDAGKLNIKINDKIILLGSSKQIKFDAWDWSNILNTIPYEITCNISKRVPRIYKGY